MEFLNIPHTLLWGHFAGKSPANHTRYNILWAQEDERTARIVNPAEKKIVNAAGIEPSTSR
jgi:hypothetical protein